MEKILMSRIALILAILFCTGTISAQGLYETTLSTNAVLIKKYAEMSQKGPMGLRAAGDTISLDPDLGILDDFSYDGPYPDTAIWLDDFVYINRGFAKAPISLGTATFEGLNNAGIPYNWAATTTSSNIADYLTSKPIDLSVVAQNDTTVFFSFYCQPQGIGNGPETKDSLVLEFKEVGTLGPWRHIWSIEGDDLSPGDSSWTFVIVPVNDSAFLQKGFQFRFKNYATLLGNLDHWHLDYVYLNKGRSLTDTLDDDVSWVYHGNPLLKNYQAMPWKHYKKSELRDSVFNLIRNNYPDQRNMQYEFVITDDITSATIDTDNGASNILPFDTTLTYTACDFAIGCIDVAHIDTTLFPSTLSAPGHYTITHYFKNGTTIDKQPENDTLRVPLELTNYYAYDDGTAESGVGGFTSGSSIELAVKYTINVSDTLQYVDIYFNPIITNVSFYNFKLKVWNTSGGAPGTLLFTSATDLNPSYYGTGPDMFVRYPLSTPLYLAAGTYFVGLLEYANWFMNIGLDKSKNTQDKVYYNAGSGWAVSPYEGSMMIRPVFGSGSDFVGVNENTAKKESDLTVYPNPANDLLFFSSSSLDLTKTIRYEIFDLFGRKMMQEQTTSASADVSSLAGGIYFIRIEAEGKISTQKFIIAH